MTPYVFLFIVHALPIQGCHENFKLPGKYNK